MPTYIALLRGIAPSGKNMQNDKLRGAFEELSCTNVRSVTSSGNIIFESPHTHTSALESQIETAWPKKLGFSPTVIIRSLDELETLIKKDPFKGYSHTAKTSLNVTFLKSPSKPSASPPAGIGYTMTAKYKREICVVIDTTSSRTPDYMTKAEKIYGSQITTRTWNTILRILAKAQA